MRAASSARRLALETSGVWQGAVTLSDPIVISDSPRVVTTPAGEVTVAWTENAAQAIKVVTRPGRRRVPSGQRRNHRRAAGQADQLGDISRHPPHDACTWRPVQAGPSSPLRDRMAPTTSPKPSSGQQEDRGRTRRRRRRRHSRRRALTSGRGTARISPSTASATPWPRGREAASFRRPHSTPRLRRSPPSTSPRPARRVSQSQHRPARSTPGRRWARGSRAGTSATASSRPARPSPTSMRRPGRTP